MREPVRRRGTHATYSDEQLRIATIGVSGGRWLTRGRFATPAEFLSRIVARVEGYTYDAIMWDVSIVQAPFSVAPCQTLMFRFATFCIAVYAGRVGGTASPLGAARCDLNEVARRLRFQQSRYLNRGSRHHPAGELADDFGELGGRDGLCGPPSARRKASRGAATVCALGQLNFNLQSEK